MHPVTTIFAKKSTLSIDTIMERETSLYKDNEKI